MIKLACLALLCMALAPLHPDLAILLGIPVCIGLLMLLVAESLRK